MTTEKKTSLKYKKDSRTGKTRLAFRCTEKTTTTCKLSKMVSFVRLVFLLSVVFSIG